MHGGAELRQGADLLCSTEVPRPLLPAQALPHAMPPSASLLQARLRTFLRRAAELRLRQVGTAWAARVERPEQRPAIETVPATFAGTVFSFTD